EVLGAHLAQLLRSLDGADDVVGIDLAAVDAHEVDARADEQGRARDRVEAQEVAFDRYPAGSEPAIDAVLGDEHADHRRESNVRAALGAIRRAAVRRTRRRLEAPFGGHCVPSSTMNQPPSERSERAAAKRTKRAQ